MKKVSDKVVESDAEVLALQTKMMEVLAHNSCLCHQCEFLKKCGMKMLEHDESLEANLKSEEPGLGGFNDMTDLLIGWTPGVLESVSFPVLTDSQIKELLYPPASGSPAAIAGSSLNS